MEEIKVQIVRKTGINKDFVDACVYAYGDTVPCLYKNVTPEFLSAKIYEILKGDSEWKD